MIEPGQLRRWTHGVAYEEGDVREFFVTVESTMMRNSAGELVDAWVILEDGRSVPRHTLVVELYSEVVND